MALASDQRSVRVAAWRRDVNEATKGEASRTQGNHYPLHAARLRRIPPRRIRNGSPEFARLGERWGQREQFSSVRRSPRSIRC
jgi:hypothetical protein